MEPQQPEQPVVSQPAPEVVQSQPPTEQPSAPASPRKWLIIGGAVLVAVLAAGVAVLGYQNFKAGQQTPTPTPNAASELPPAPPPVPGESTSDETANWNSYTSNKFNFTIKYPKRISAYDENWQYEEFDGQVGFGTPSSKSGGYFWGVGVSEDKGLEELIKEIGKQFSDRQETRKNITIDSQPAIFVTVTTNQYSDWISKIIYIEHKGMIYIIGNGAIEIPEFDLFYNTFKFLE